MKVSERGYEKRAMQVQNVKTIIMRTELEIICLAGTCQGAIYRVIISKVGAKLSLQFLFRDYISSQFPALLISE